ncbi:MAG: glycosyltransferase family 9 protein, partial [Alphaproteobacteria bacterium]
LWPTPEHRETAAALLPGESPVIGVGPATNWRAKTWRATRFADLLSRLTAADGMLPRARIAVFGGPSEREEAMTLITELPAERRIDLVGTLDLVTTYACLERCSFYVGNDSGLMHLAAAAGVATLGLFGPSQEVHYAPWGLRTAVVRTPLPFERIFPEGFDHRNSDTLMDGLTVDKVEEAAVALYRGSRERTA